MPMITMATLKKKKRSKLRIPLPKQMPKIKESDKKYNRKKIKR